MGAVDRTAIRSVAPGEHAVCEHILRALPAWFGIESSLVQYVADVQRYPTWLGVDSTTNEPLGVLTLHQHFPESAEIHCMAVLPDHHRRGVGRALIAFAESEVRSRGAEYLQVKTQGPSRPCEAYTRTRAFYRALGFAPLEEIHGLWPGNPCLVLVKRL